MSATIPRPVDYDETDEMIKNINKCLRSEMGPVLGFHFVDSNMTEEFVAVYKALLLICLLILISEFLFLSLYLYLYIS